MPEVGGKHFPYTAKGKAAAAKYKAKLAGIGKPKGATSSAPSADVKAAFAKRRGAPRPKPQRPAPPPIAAAYKKAKKK